VGKALLSELSDAEINSLFPEEKLQQVTNKTIDSKTKLKLELEQIRKTGISYNKGGLFEGGEGIGSIIRDAKGVAIAGLSITMPVFRIEQFGRNRLAELIRMGAILISYRLGYQGEAKPVHDVQEIRSWWEQSQ
jgi:DNA-binding IclR family transcriptional regulator